MAPRSAPGVLFFPIRAGFGGLIPILVMLVLAYPIAFYCHRALARLRLSGANPSGNITETVEEHFGKTGGVVITFLYFFAIRPLLWIYGVTITNTFMTFWDNELQMPALNRGVVALLLLLMMAFVIWFGKTDGQGDELSGVAVYRQPGGDLPVPDPLLE